MFAQLRTNIYNAIQSFLKQFSQLFAQLKQLKQSIVTLKENSEQLQKILPEVKDLQTDVDRSVAKFKFKTDPRLEKIEYHLNHIQTELKKYQRR